MRGYLYDRLRAMAPYSVRQWIKRQPWFFPLAQRLLGTRVYSKSYYDDVERLENDSVPHVAEWIVEHFRPSRVIDVGCGPGHLMEQLAQRGVDVFGVDIAEQSLKRTRQRGLAVERHDLTDPNVDLPGTPYDLAISCEVAEHLEERYAELFVRKLTAASDRIYLTAAEPSDTDGVGMYHFNEQPHEWWIELFERHGFDLDEAATEQARKVLVAKSVIEYLARPLIFQRRADL